MYYKDPHNRRDEERDHSFHERQMRIPIPPQRPRRPKHSFDQQKFYLALVYDEASQQVARQSSSNLKPFQNDILYEASQKFAAVLQSHFATPGAINETDVPVEIAKRSRNEDAQTGMRKEDFSRPHKARRVKSKVFVDALSRMSQNTGLSAQNSQEDTVQYHLSSREDWERWFSDAFRAVQQVSCRTIAKEWIKLIHPKKQSTHPYNGKNPRTGERGDPDSTKPSYWPRDVIHKEPDHINKQERTKLLVHLLMNTPHKEMSPLGEPRTEKEIDAMALKEALEQKGSERGSELSKKFWIIEQIVEARMELERYEQGGFADKNVSYSVTNFADFSRGSRTDDDSDDPPDEAFEVFTEQEDSNDDDVVIAATGNTGPQVGDNELPLIAQPSHNSPTELEIRPKSNKKSKKGGRSLTFNTTQKSPGPWHTPPVPSNFGIHPSQPFDYEGWGTGTMEYEATKLQEHMQIQPSQDIGRQVRGFYPPVGWHPISGQIELPTQYDGSNIPSPKPVVTMEQGHLMQNPYAGMPPASFSRVPHFFQPISAGNSPYHYERQPSQAHEQMIAAYF